MSGSKKLILGTGIAIIIIMGVVPPWKAAINKTPAYLSDVMVVHTYVYKYGLIFAPPHQSNDNVAGSGAGTVTVIVPSLKLVEMGKPRPFWTSELGTEGVSKRNFTSNIPSVPAATRKSSLNRSPVTAETVSDSVTSATMSKVPTDAKPKFDESMRGPERPRGGLPLAV